MLPDQGAATPEPVATPAPEKIPGKPLGFWKTQVDLSIKARQKHEPWWEANLKAYAPGPDGTPSAWGSEVNTNRDFVLVERKKADLFYQKPDVTLQPSPLLEAPRPVMGPNGQPQMGPNGQPQMTSDLPSLAAHEQIVNESLGPDGVDVLTVVHQALFDVLCTSGIGATVMGYESITTPVEDIDPMTGMPTVIPVPVSETCFWHHISPKKLVIPHDWKSVQWDKAPYLGFRFTLPLTAANREKYQLPEDFSGSKPTDEDTFSKADGADGVSTFTGTELWYRSSLFRDDIRHPEHLTHLVLVDGLDTFALHEDCPYQTVDDRGRLTPDSLIGFPIHPLTVRVLTDSAYPPSDCTVIRPLVNELNKFRRQMVQYRDAQTLRWQYNTDTLPLDALSKIVQSPIGGMIGVPAEAFQTDAIKELPHGSMPRESFTSNDYIDQDISRTTAIDASGAGVQSSKAVTATETNIVQANANARLDFERGRVLDWFIKGVTKFSTLEQRYYPVEKAAQLVGPQAAQAWDEWRKRTPATLAFTAMPDSALRVDQAIDRKQAQELYTYLANDPYVQKGRGKLLERLLRKYHIDPTGIVAPPDPPKPAPPGLSFSFKGEDLVGPQAPIVVEIAMQLGLKISPAAIQQSQQILATQQQMAAEAEAAEQAAKGNTMHGGKMAPMESLDKHQADSGMGMQGMGGVSPTGGGAPQGIM